MVVSTVAGNGSSFPIVDGPAATAQLGFPVSLEVADDGSLLFLDGRVRKISFAGGTATVSTVAGGGNVTNADSSGAQAGFRNWNSLALDRNGSTLVVEPNLVRRVVQDASGSVSVNRFAGYYNGRFDDPSRDGPLLYGFDFTPNDLGLDGDGNLIVSTVDTHQILRITADPGTPSVSVLAGDGQQGYKDGEGATARFNSPQDVATASDGSIYVSDSNNHCIRKFTFDGSGGAVVSTIAGTPTVSGYVDGGGQAARFKSPGGLAVAPDGGFYVADTGNHCIRRIVFDAQGSATVETIAGKATGLSGSHVDGPGPVARFFNPVDVMLDERGDLLVSDSKNYCIRKITFNDGGNVTVSTLAGGGGYSYADGPGSLAGFSDPRMMALGADGSIYVVDYTRLRRLTIDQSGQVMVSTVAGTNRGFSDGPALAARFGGNAGGGVIGITIDPEGDIYLADEGNRLIRKVLMP